MENKKTIQSRLLEFQGLVHAVKKDSVNPFFKSNYADINAYLDVIKPILTQVGLALLQPLTTVDGKPAIKTILLSEEERLEETIIIPENTDPQKMGATITYFRRYALQSLLALQAEDDDGNSVVQPSYETVQSTPHPTQQGANKEQCNKCGAEMVFNPKTGKHFCSERCWLK